MRELPRGSAVAELEQNVLVLSFRVPFAFPFAFAFAYRQTHWFSDSFPPGDK